MTKHADTATEIWFSKTLKSLVECKFRWNSERTTNHIFLKGSYAWMSCRRCLWPIKILPTNTLGWACCLILAWNGPSIWEAKIRMQNAKSWSVESSRRDEHAVGNSVWMTLRMTLTLLELVILSLTLTDIWGILTETKFARWYQIFVAKRSMLSLKEKANSMSLISLSRSTLTTLMLKAASSWML